jgi:hypothetical protein
VIRLCGPAVDRRRAHRTEQLCLFVGARETHRRAAAPSQGPGASERGACRSDSERSASTTPGWCAGRLAPSAACVPGDHGVVTYHPPSSPELKALQRVIEQSTLSVGTVDLHWELTDDPPPDNLRAEQDQLWRAAASSAQIGMARRHVEIARRVQDKLLLRLETLTIDEIAVRDLPRLLDLAIRIERQAMGLEGSRVSVELTAAPELPVDISRRILATPEGRDLAARQIEDLAKAAA